MFQTMTSIQVCQSCTCKFLYRSLQYLRVWVKSHCVTLWDDRLRFVNCSEIWYSRRFATATARTASLGSHSRGIETKNIRKYWLSEKKKTRRIWWPCIADQRSSKNNEKHEKTAKLLLFTVFLRGEKQKPLQIPWFLRVRWPKTL